MAWGPVGPTVKATAVDGGYRVNGTWSYASGSRHAQWLGGHSPLVDADGKPCLGAGRQADRADDAVPEIKATIRDVWQVMGLKGTGSDSYTVTDLFVPARYTFTREFAAERRESGPLYRFTTYQIYGSAFAAWRSASRGRRSMPSCRWPPPRCRCWARSRCATTPWCSPRSRSPRRNGNRRAPI